MPQILDRTMPAAAPGEPDALPPLPFVFGARRQRRIFHDNTSAALSASSQQVGPVSVTATGFLRFVTLHVELTGGTGGAAVAGDRGIWNVLDRVRLQDTNGTTMIDLSGHEAYLADKWLGRFPAAPDPALGSAYSALDANGNGSFVLSVPVEISGRDALGALGNQNASQTYQFEYVLADKGAVFTTDPFTTRPTVRVRAYVDSWSTVSGPGPNGRPIAQQPPAHGTIQYVRAFHFDVETGEQELLIQRTGNHIRALIVVKTDAAGLLDTAGLPPELELRYNHTPIERVNTDLHRNDLSRVYGWDAAEGQPGGLDVGVVGWQWDDDLDGTPGYGSRRQLLATTPATDLRVVGNFQTAGRVTIIQADIAPSGAFVGE